MDIIQQTEQPHLKAETPELKSGYTIRVHQRVEEGDKERIQVFEGIIIAVKHGRGINGTFTVRRIASGVGVERIFPLHSPNITKVEVVKKAKVRRSKLYFLRQATSQKRRFSEERMPVASASGEPKPAAAKTAEPKSIKDKAKQNDSPTAKDGK